MYGVAPLLQKILDVGLDALDTAGRPPVDVSGRYHSDPVAARCCNALFVFWPRVAPDRAGIPPGEAAPPGRAQVDISLRLYRCWPKLANDGTAPTGTDDAAEGLALDLDALWNGYTAAICARDFADVTVGIDGLILVDFTPRPTKTCAGIQGRFTGTPRPWAPDSPGP